MIRHALLVAIAIGLFGCRRHYAEPRMLEEPPYIEGHEPPEVVPQRTHFEIDLSAINAVDLESIYVGRPVMDDQPQFASQPALIRHWPAIERPICGGGPHVLYGDDAGDTWLQVSEGFTGRLAWYGPVHVDELRAAVAALD